MKLKSRANVRGTIETIEDSTFTITEATPNHAVTLAYKDIKKISKGDCCL